MNKDKWYVPPTTQADKISDVWDVVYNFWAHEIRETSQWGGMFAGITAKDHVRQFSEVLHECRG